VLFVDCLFEHRALLFDLGDIHALPPRKLMRITTCSSAMPTWIISSASTGCCAYCWDGKRICSCSVRRFLAQVEHRLRAYTWNLVAQLCVHFTLRVTEAGWQRGGRCASFRCQNVFLREE